MLPQEEAVIVLADSGGNVLLAGFVVNGFVVQNGENLLNVLRTEFFVCCYAFAKFFPGFSANGDVDFVFGASEIGENGSREFIGSAAAKILVKLIGAFRRSEYRNVYRLDIFRADGIYGLLEGLEGLFVVQERVEELALISGEVESKAFLLRVCVRAEEQT